MSETLCHRSDLPPSMCWHCRPAPEWTPPALMEGVYHPPTHKGEPMPRFIFSALTACRCAWCHRTIRPGERMGHDTDTGDNVCAECVS